jgi:hypothetical protein
MLLANAGEGAERLLRGTEEQRTVDVVDQDTVWQAHGLRMLLALHQLSARQFDGAPYEQHRGQPGAHRQRWFRQADPCQRQTGEALRAGSRSGRKTSINGLAQDGR